MATVPADLDAFLDWAQTDKGPGAVFAATFLRVLKDAEKKPAPVLPLDVGAEAMVWRDLASIRAFSMAHLDIGADAFKADEAKWWRHTGAKLINDLVQARRRMAGSAGAWNQKESRKPGSNLILES